MRFPGSLPAAFLPLLLRPLPRDLLVLLPSLHLLEIGPHGRCHRAAVRRAVPPLAAPDSLGEESALLNFGLALLVNLEGQTHRTNFLAVEPAGAA